MNYKIVYGIGALAFLTSVILLEFFPNVKPNENYVCCRNPSHQANIFAFSDFSKSEWKLSEECNKEDVLDDNFCLN